MAYIPDGVALEFEWDKAKSDACFRQRGFDFAFAARVFSDPDRIDAVDDRYEYGEDRHIAFGRIDGLYDAVVYTLRGSVQRIISARRAHYREVRRIAHGDY